VSLRGIKDSLGGIVETSLIRLTAPTSDMDAFPVSDAFSNITVAQYDADRWGHPSHQQCRSATSKPVPILKFEYISEMP
jgi:hypothetical protein